MHVIELETILSDAFGDGVPFRLTGDDRVEADAALEADRRERMTVKRVESPFSDGSSSASGVH